jgi:hypothetical protein
MKRLSMALALTVCVLPGVASAANKDLVILTSERWIDTLKGTIKNVSAARAEEVVIVVRFFGHTLSHTRPQRGRPVPRQELGRQTAKVVALDPGQEAPFEVEIAEKHRATTSFTFEPHAIWHTKARVHSGGR